MARYAVREGDTVNGILQAAGITLEDFLRLNPEIDPNAPRRSIEALVGRDVRLGPGFSIEGAAGTKGDGSHDEFGNLITSATELAAIEQQREAAKRLDSFDPSQAFDQGAGAEPVLPGFEDIVIPGSIDDPNAQQPTTPGPTTPTPTGPTGPTPEEREQGFQNAYQMALSAFPWVEQMGLGGRILDWIREGYESNALVGLIRQTDEWGSMFVGLRRGDGTLRMNESAYLSTMDNYRQVLQRFLGPDGLSYSNSDLANFLEAEVDANELGDRLRIYDQVVQGGSEIRSAFYVYAGISMSDDDLYGYVVDPFTQQSFDEQYSAADDPDYATFLGRTTDIVTQDTGGTVSRDEAGETLDFLYHGGNPDGGDYLSLAELTNSFELAMLGSTATLQGLILPDRATLQRMREAGVSRAQAIQAYGQFARDRNLINAIVSRVGGDEFTQNEFEETAFLADPDSTNELQRAQRQEDSRSRPGGSFSFNQSQGRLTQSGLSAFRS